MIAVSSISRKVTAQDCTNGKLQRQALKLVCWNPEPANLSTMLNGKKKKVLCFSPTPPHLMPSLLVLTKSLEEKATGSDSTGEGIYTVRSDLSKFT